MTYEEFVKAVEENVQKTPETYKRYKQAGGSTDENAEFYINVEYRSYKNGADLEHAIEAAASCIVMEY